MHNYKCLSKIPKKEEDKTQLYPPFLFQINNALPLHFQNPEAAISSCGRPDLASDGKEEHDGPANCSQRLSRRISDDHILFHLH